MNNPENKISPAFEPYLAASDSKTKHEAIVLYRSPKPKEKPVRGRLRTLKQRLAAIEQQSKAQTTVQSKVFRDYRSSGAKHFKGKEVLRTEKIADNWLPVASMEVTKKTVEDLAAQPNVVAIMPNQRISLIKPMEIDYGDLMTSEVNAGMTWGLKRLDIPTLWNTTQGEDINVAVLDTGVYADHPALAGRVKEFVLVDPLGRRIESSMPFDGGSHGTHVCGTIAGGKSDVNTSIGVAPKANLLVGAVLVGESTLLTLLQGISWAMEKGADIINMSLGFTYYEPHFTKVFEDLLDLDILPVVAIGNENHGNTSSPGNAWNAFSIGALEKLPYNKVDVTFFSSGASLAFPDDSEHALIHKPDVVAPGAQVYSCIPPEQTSDGTIEYDYYAGTSMATPHVAGVCALLMAAKPTAPVGDIVDALRDTAKHPNGDSRPDNRWGWGEVQPVDALASL